MGYEEFSEDTLIEQREKARASGDALTYFYLYKDTDDAPEDEALFAKGQNEDQFQEEQGGMNRLEEMTNDDIIRFQFGGRAFRSLSDEEKRSIVILRYGERIKGRHIDRYSHEEIHKICQTPYRQLIGPIEA